MTCAKKHVICDIVTKTGRTFSSYNHCENPQDTCPREEGEDYAKCTSICKQIGHAEINALRAAGDYANGARAYIYGNTFCCRECQEALFAAGVISISVSKTIEERTEV